MIAKGKDGMYSEAQLWEFYVRFNEVYFQSVLPLPCEIAYASALPSRDRRAVACVAWTSFGLGLLDEYRILLLRPFFNGKDPRLALCSLLHEMVHIYELRLGRCEHRHGPLFRSACERLRQLGWNVDTLLDARLPAFDPHRAADGRGGLMSALRALVKSLWR